MLRESGADFPFREPSLNVRIWYRKSSIRYTPCLFWTLKHSGADRWVVGRNRSSPQSHHLAVGTPRSDPTDIRPKSIF